ncbi:glycosyltransferase [Candidatus Woesearchaeota archaeon]|nr:MAG: glycosyltransferase [Candidatus Woesearchaeota archaeon]
MKNPSSSKRPVVIFIPSLIFGGAEKVAVQLASHLSKTRRVSFLTLEKGAEFDIPDGVSTVCLSSLDGRASPLLKILFFPVHLFRAWRFFRKNRNVITISFMMRTSLFAALLRLPNLVFSLHIHASTFFATDKLGPLISLVRNLSYKLLLRRLNSRAAVTTVPSRLAAVDLVDNFGFDPARVRTVYNPLELERISELSKEHVPESWSHIFDGLTLVNHGRLTDQKGHANLLRMFSLVKKSVPEAKLLLVGDGELRSFLMDFSRNLGLRPVFLPSASSVPKDADVFFAGFQKNPYKFLARSDIFVFPSLWEGFPVALIEACAVGLPIIAADCKSGPRELLAPDSDISSSASEPEFSDFGVLMPSLLPCRVDFSNPSLKACEKEKTWADIIIKFLRDSSLRKRFSSLAKKRAEDFSFEAIMKEWDDVLRSASGK